MVARVNTVAFQGIDVVPVDVQVHLGGGLPNFNVVGLPDKTVGESRERVRAAIAALGLSLPTRRRIGTLRIIQQYQYIKNKDALFIRLSCHLTTSLI